MIVHSGISHGLAPAARSIRPCHSSVGSPRDAAMCASPSGEPSPLDELPASLANRFRHARSQKRARSAQVQRPTGSSTSQSSGPVPTAPGDTSRLSLADVWKETDADGSSSPSAAAAADKSVLTELAKVQAQTLVDSVGGSGKGATGRSKGRSSFLDSIDVADSPSGNPAPTARSGRSRRTEDEEIRASRQQRMEEQGLDGSADTGWRTGDEAPNTSSNVMGARDFSELLRPDSSDSDVDVGLSAEQFTLQKEARERDRGAGIISADASYKPAVGTWGVYQRPRDISKAYGGGRTLTPADSATSEEEQAKLDAQLEQQLAVFRRNAGIDVDPETEASCKELTSEGKVLLRKGNLRSALVIFEEAAGMLSPKTDAGGQALLQKAITLDSMGNSEDALNIYRQLRKHRCLEVAKTAKRMSYGFRAGEFLKAEQFSYAAKKEEYEPFFSALRGKWGWDTAYVASDEDKAAEKKGNMLLAAVLVIITSAPLGFFYFVSQQC